MEVGGSQENIFKVRQHNIDRWHKEGQDDFCYNCKQKFTTGQLCHSKLVGGGYQKRHVVCAIKIGVLKMSIMDYRIWAAGLKEEKKVFEKMLKSEALKVEQELQEQVQMDYPYLKVRVEVVPPKKVSIPTISGGR